MQLELLTWDSSLKEDVVRVYEDVRTAMEAFFDTPFESIARLQSDGKTVVEHEFDFEDGWETLFWGPDAEMLKAEFQSVVDSRTSRHTAEP